MGTNMRTVLGLRLVLTGLLPALIALGGCGPEEKEVPDVEDDDDVVGEEGEGENETDLELEPGNQCELDEDCDDHVDCTQDVCDNGNCINTPDDGACDDSLACNGEEVCNVEEGCLPGEIFRGCFDADPCTMDICVEGEPGDAPHCEFPLLDRDVDGHIDMHCEGGDDCNDLSDRVYPGARELCFDDLDNDCNGVIDFNDEACMLTNDTCETPRSLELDVMEEGFTFGAIGDIDSSCDAPDFPDVSYAFELASESDVIITVSGRDGLYTYVAIQTACGDYASTLHCNSGQPFQFCQKGMAAGTYYLVISSWDEGAFDILVDVEPPGPPLEGDTCDTAVAITGDGHWEGDLLCMTDDLSFECASWADYKDMVYTFTLDEVQDVRIRASAVLFSPYVSLHQDCDTPSPAVMCASDYPFDRRITRVEAGTYFLAIESYTPGAFSLDLNFLPASEPPANETCDGAVDVTAGGTFPGSLLASSDDYMSSCMPGYLDAFYTFTLAESRDVHLSVRGTGSFTPFLVVQDVCGDMSSELRCHNITPADVLLRSLPAGDYWVVVEGAYGGEFELEAELLPPTSACDGATVLSTTTTVSGTTAGRFNDFESTCGYYAKSPDRPYILRLDSPADVTAQITTATFDTVLHLRTACDDPSSQIVCDDDGGGSGWSRIERAGLEAGDYVLIVDGYGWWSSGDYTLSVTVTPL